MTHNETSASEDLLRVEEVLKTAIRSSTSAPRELGNRLIDAGGKRLRPFLVCLTFRSLSNSQKLQARGTEEDLFHLAAVSELVHTATLFHDDVIDHSESRRGMTTAHILAGNKNAVLVGDFVYAEAFFVLMERGLLNPSKELAGTVKGLVDGELLQHAMSLERSLDRHSYEQVALAKTGTLFGWCTGTGAWLAGSEHFALAKEFGRTLGYAFQMADDLIDTYEIIPQTASEADLLSWIDTAPPLPLVLAAEIEDHHGNSVVASQWKRALNVAPAERANLVHKLQEAARNSAVIRASLEKIQDALSSARKQLETLGLTTDLSWTIDRIWERAQQGAKLSEASPEQRKHHGLI
jgi:octaprenyl-diphosphate synthase